jgi:antitoxin HicB
LNSSMPRDLFMNTLDYPIIIEPLPAPDGGGFAAFVPDLPGCMSDGETQHEAVANVQDAIRAWIEAAKEMGRAVPPPSRHLAIAS